MTSMDRQPAPLSIPVIDLHDFLLGDKAQKAATAARVDDICRSIGFLVIQNHDVPDATVSAAWQAAEDFFALPEKQKLRSRSDDASCPRGYFPMASETLAKTLQDNNTPPDLKEAFSCGPLRKPGLDTSIADYDFFYGDNIWPSEPADFQQAWTDYYEAMEDLGARLMQLFAAALSLDLDFFADMHSHHLSALRTLNYPALKGNPLPGQQGAGAHSDYGSVTILRPDPDVVGLEVRMPDGVWRQAPSVGSGFLVNIGDMLARWTNDRWVSTLHRVVTKDATRRRQSIAYFQNPNYDAVIRCIPTCLARGDTAKFEPVLAGAYLMEKFSAAQ